MTFAFSERHIEDYSVRGAAILRGILPPALIGDLRRATDKGRELARQVRGPQAQRLQPLTAYDIDLQPFDDYASLPELRDAIDKILGPEFLYGNPSKMGVLLEPAELPYCTAWHRDLRDNVSGFDIGQWDELCRDPHLMNQVNCPLYEDICTWIVPGSHLRDDSVRERELFSRLRPIPRPDLENKTSEERERACLEYCRGMPGGEQLILNAGDFVLYRSNLWHIGNYVPYRKRATLHDGVTTPQGAARAAVVFEQAAQRAAQGYGVPDPYGERAMMEQ